MMTTYQLLVSVSMTYLGHAQVDDAQKKAAADKEQRETARCSCSSIMTLAMASLGLLL